MEARLVEDAGELPGGDVGEALVVALGLAVRGLVLLAEVGAAGLVAVEGVDISGDPYQVAARATDDVEKQEEIAQVLKALDELPTDQKEVIVLGVFQDLSYAEIEDITGTKAVTLRSRMFHGLKRLARTLGSAAEPEVKAEERG